MTLDELLKVVDNKEIHVYTTFPVADSYNHLYWKVTRLTDIDGEPVHQFDPYVREEKYYDVNPASDTLELDTGVEVDKVTTMSVADEGSEPHSVLVVVI